MIMGEVQCEQLQGEMQFFQQFMQDEGVELDDTLILLSS
jgi:hypothetical protein